MIDGDQLRLDLRQPEGRLAAAAALPTLQRLDAGLAADLHESLDTLAVDAAEKSALLRLYDNEAARQAVLDSLSNGVLSPEEAERLAQDALDLSSGCSGC